jgi:RimJ/RimL family protein N-acetyltransferase
VRLSTSRLDLRPFDAGDEPFILELLNDPGWIRFIGDRNIRTLTDAGGYIERIRKSQDRFGFSLLRVALKGDDTPIGMCGLIKRDNFEDIDIGFAFMPAYRGQGYAREAAQAVRDYAVEVLGLPRIVAFTDVENHASGKLLERLGFIYEGEIAWGEGDGRSTLYGYQPPR